MTCNKVHKNFYLMGCVATKAEISDIFRKKAFGG